MRSIQNRILLLIVLIAVSMLGGTLISQRMEHQRIHALIDKKKQEASILLSHVVDFKSKSLQNFAYDYTFWDEMVSFTEHTQAAWAADNIEVSLPTFNIQAAWVFGADFSLLYHFQTNQEHDLSTFPLNEQQLRKLASTGPLYDFFVQTPEALIQISGGSIHPSSDAERKTTPKGYFFVGRIWNESYIADIENFTETKVSLVQPTGSMPVDTILLSEFSYLNFLPLNGWNREAQAYLRSSGVMDIARDFSQRFQAHMLILVVSLLIGLVFISFILVRLINNPLRNLITSLVNDDPEPIRPLIATKSEFGHIANLMNNFFVQKKKLIAEIDERRKVEVALIEAKNRAEESDRLKTTFLNNISHEIRTPMNAIVGFSELLVDSRVSEQDRIEFTRIICDSSYRLLSVITDLINISTIETGQLTIIEEKVELNSMLQAIFLRFNPELDNHPVKLSLDVALKDEHSTIFCDATKLNQVIVNLLSNAVKFTQSGKIEFGYTIRESKIEFYVFDTGIGIPTGKFETIFARFQQVDDSSSRQYGGSGLGLPISKAYVELMGGTIWLTSEEGAGSKFYFTIPYKPV